MTQNVKSIVSASKEASVQSPEKSMTVKNYTQVRTWLGKGSVRDQFMAVMGEEHAPRFMQALLLLMKNPNYTALNKCDPHSIVRSAMVSATIGLSIDPNLSQSALIPYKDQCTFQVMRRGLQQLTYRTGTVAALNTAKVYAGDIKSFNPFTGEYVYNEEPHERVVLEGWIGYIKQSNGFEKYLYMSIDDLKAWGRRYSKSFNYGMWQTNFEIMCDKTIAKRVIREGGIIDPYSTTPMNQLALAMKFDHGVPKSLDLSVDSEAEYPDAGSSYEEVEINTQTNK